ncbi:MAG TPA: SAM-dependent methyltransferase, partial [Myxococcales bacterium]|nr:SAM-dependent methyltransferase [Myxococcales bacterium]
MSVDLDEPEITVDAEDDAAQDDAGERALDGESDAEVEELDVDLDADAPDDDAAPELAEDELLEEDGASRPSKPPPPPRGEKAPPPPPEKAAEKAEPARAEKAEAKKDAAKEGAAKARARKTRRKWYETLFNDDYLRTVPIPHPRTIEKQCDFIEQRFGLAKGATILDVGCGLGLHAVELTRRGYLVVGLDLSLPMLSRAADEAQEHGFKINFLHADMREMNFDGAFDAVLCWGTTLGYFDDETNKQVIERLYRALKPRGLLLLEVVNRDYVIRTQPNLVWFEGDGCVVMEETQMNYITSRLETKRTVILDDGRQRDNLYSIRLFSLHELGQVLHHQGFRVVEVSGREAHPGVFFGADSPQLLILAERRPQGPPTPPGRGSSSSMK